MTGNPVASQLVLPVLHPSPASTMGMGFINRCQGLWHLGGPVITCPTFKSWWVLSCLCIDSGPGLLEVGQDGRQVALETFSSLQCQRASRDPLVERAQALPGKRRVKPVSIYGTNLDHLPLTLGALVLSLTEGKRMNGPNFLSPHVFLYKGTFLHHFYCV